MSVVAWWVVPVVCTLLAGLLLSLRGRRPHIRRAFEEVESFRRFQDAVERQRGKAARPGR